ncbi:MAG: DUF4384 domain-containing protein [Hyphomicrobiaceae bacterium]|nr:DUF4384 domain-containing protein [Hyphomicrobiaceae bacterium]
MAALIAAMASLALVVGGWPNFLVAAPASQPLEPRAARVFAIFDAACSSCHQSGKLAGAVPGGLLGNVLTLSEIAAEPHLVRPGEPDASRLYQVLLDRHRPFDLPLDAPWPQISEIQRVRTFIEELTPRKPSCALASVPLTTDAIATEIDRAAAELGEAAGGDLRFITLTHFANGCATEAELDGYRQAIAKLLNSVSWGLRPVTLKRVDPAGSILAFRLSDIGWIPEHWVAVASAEPVGVALDLTGRLTVPFADPRPVRGDWFAAAIRDSVLYDELLGLPPTLEEIVRLLGINRDGEIGTAKAPRAAVRQSLVTRGPRVIERFQADTRRLWVAYDTAEGTAERDVFDRPLGYIRSAPERYRFRADGLRAMFTLPNGYLAYTVFDADGRRLSEVPAAIETPSARWAGKGPAACISCHGAGAVPFTDAMRGHLQSDKFAGPKEIRDSALAVYGTDLSGPRDDDAFRFRRAMIQSGVDPDRLIHGLEPTTALARRYELDVDERTLAAEVGMTVTGLEVALAATSAIDKSVTLRLRQGTLTRGEANAVLARLRGSSSSADGTASAGPLRMSMWTDRIRYKVGEIVTFNAVATGACNLTLIGIDPAGKATVLFPSEFEPDNLLQPLKPMTVPASGSQYQFRLRERGVETIVGVCQSGVKFPSGIEPDYERQRFTVLGSYENFERTAFELDAEARARSLRPVKPAREQKPEQRPGAVARTAIRLVIE